MSYTTATLGFLCLDTEEAAGNMGMLDMVTALEWVQKYIHHFGGNKSEGPLESKFATILSFK